MWPILASTYPIMHDMIDLAQRLKDLSHCSCLLLKLLCNYIDKQATVFLGV